MSCTDGYNNKSVISVHYVCLQIGDAVAKTRSIVHVNSLYLHGKMSCKLAVTHCVICRTDVANDDDVATVSRGLNTLLEFSQKYNDAELYEYLLSKPPVVKVHNKCRNNYTSKTKLEQVLKRAGEQNESEVVKKKVLRSSAVQFEWATHCFFCGELCVKDIRHPERCDRRRVETLQIKDRVLQMCEQRLFLSLADELALAVQRRVMNCCDLVAAEAVYYRKCHTVKPISHCHSCAPP